MSRPTLSLGRVERALLVVAAVVVGAGWLAVPNRGPPARCHEGTRLARQSLRQLLVFEEDFRDAHGGYGADLAAVGVATVVSDADGAVYRLAVTDVYADRFVGWAFRSDGVDDVWRTNERLELEHVVDRCR